jgi:DNA (cytosine-5)-methyltransferase 1
MQTDQLRFIDLFAGIGGMRIPFDELGCNCVFSCDWDKDAQRVYEANFGEKPAGDITQITAADIPDHDILLAGFPCQAFSIIGKMNGFQDTRGTLFFEIERILKEKLPSAFLLENVKMLVGHKKGYTFKTILECLKALGYSVCWKVLNALDFGLPHKRERVFIVGFRQNFDFAFPKGAPGQYKTLSEILEKDVPKKYYASKEIIQKRKKDHTASVTPSIWHENKGGNISSHPFSCALRAGASYNYLLVNGERRLTPRECLRLLGFPEWYDVNGSYTSIRKVTGNSVAVPVVRDIAKEMLRCLKGDIPIRSRPSTDQAVQLGLFA